METQEQILKEQRLKIENTPVSNPVTILRVTAHIRCNDTTQRSENIDGVYQHTRTLRQKV